eukprot:CAMPEP_0174912674 /NCGR_PEP_ID=MMETSP0167-20121228/79908_1 /TAXON_ID=38298 /ORGANISM="Rhodella maculata, Strain CCMP736" /LENGTH=153 /DNA_ID=CAMNT_0016157333 /DNA_START=561 /DNA_END=1022 /DNA_ORIENTATION=+
MSTFIPSSVPTFSQLHSFVSAFRIPSPSHSSMVPRGHADRRTASRPLAFQPPLLPPKHPARTASRLVRVAARAARRTASAAFASGLACGIWVGAVRAGTVPLAHTEPAFAAIVVLIEGFEDLVPSALDATNDDTEKLRLLLKLAQCIIMLSPY